MAALALRVWRVRSTAGEGSNVRTFLPFDPEPAQVFIHRRDELRTAAVAVKIFVAKDKHAVGFAGSLVRCPEGLRVTEVKISGRRRRNASAIRHAASLANVRMAATIDIMESTRWHPL